MNGWWLERREYRRVEERTRGKVQTGLEIVEVCLDIKWCVLSCDGSLPMLSAIGLKMLRRHPSILSHVGGRANIHGYLGNMRLAEENMEGACISLGRHIFPALQGMGSFPFVIIASKASELTNPHKLEDATGDAQFESFLDQHAPGPSNQLQEQDREIA